MVVLSEIGSAGMVVVVFCVLDSRVVVSFMLVLSTLDSSVSFDARDAGGSPDLYIHRSWPPKKIHSLKHGEQSSGI